MTSTFAVEMIDEGELRGIRKGLGFFLSVGFVVILPFRMLIPKTGVTILLTIGLICVTWILWVGALAVSQASWGGLGDTTGLAIVGSFCMIVAGLVSEMIAKTYSRIYDKLAANKPEQPSPTRDESKETL